MCADHYPNKYEDNDDEKEKRNERERREMVSYSFGPLCDWEQVGANSKEPPNKLGTMLDRASLYLQNLLHSQKKERQRKREREGEKRREQRRPLA